MTKPISALADKINQLTVFTASSKKRSTKIYKKKSNVSFTFTTNLFLFM